MDAKNGSSGFRGWSGGAYTQLYHLAKPGSTPSYIPGALDPGQWNVVLGPYMLLDTGCRLQFDDHVRYDPVQDYFEPA